jgi:hypothetical protein
VASCAKQRCEKCGEELIHRDNRQAHESSSGLGQHIHNKGPKHIGFSDIDGVVHKRNVDGKEMLLLIEQKNWRHTMNRSQYEILKTLEKCIELGKKHLNLHPDSGLYLLWGDVKEGAPVYPWHRRQIDSKDYEQILNDDDLFNQFDPLKGPRHDR